MKPRYRAWDKEENRWINIASLVFDEEGELWYLSPVMDDFNPVYYENELGKTWEIMQSTGLKDKNGVEIFEGDILKCTSGIYTNLGATGTGEYEETIKQVVWKDDSWGTRVISSNLTSKGAEKSGLVISAKYAEVIGNIHENPKLLGQANEN